MVDPAEFVRSTALVPTGVPERAALELLEGSVMRITPLELVEAEAPELREELELRSMMIGELERLGELDDRELLEERDGELLRTGEELRDGELDRVELLRDVVGRDERLDPVDGRELGRLYPPREELPLLPRL